ncbi:ABC transporter permease [Brachybacterium sp. EF45031]|uniref:ABC transporter permease n=1 Tax=Brachybacterium sillae TaxID=2810536 RepID=UPI00217CDE32|nr:ABC transporter permease [Brachybacterium sillae]MCS6711495.1 ABC transporter permease [Brachybacterium sillae]
MTTTTLPTVPQPAVATARAVDTPAAHAPWWALRPVGLATVLGLELRQRIRGVRWYIAFAVWFLLINGLAALTVAAVDWAWGGNVTWQEAGSLVFGMVVFLTLTALLLVLPALASGSVNGDRSEGTLAILQATLLSPVEIAVGKLLAAWFTGLVFVALALPALVGAAALGGADPWYLLRVLLVLSILALTVSGIGLGLSALTRRPLGSVVLAYLLVLGTTFVLPVAYLGTLPFTERQHTVTVWDTVYSSVTDTGRCVQAVRTERIYHTEVALPLLAVNPYVLVSEAAPMPPPSERPFERNDMLGNIKTGMRMLAQPLHPSHFNRCWDPADPGYPKDLGTPQTLPMWPLSGGAWVLTGLLGTVLAVLRLRTPVRRLPRGMRIA